MGRQPPRHPSVADQADRILAAFRHLSHVRLDPDRRHAVVVGIRHRLPVELRVPLEVAAELQSRGVRSVRGVSRRRLAG